MFGFETCESNVFLRACRLHDWKRVEHMVRAGQADVDSMSSESMSALMYSITAKNDVMFDFLVSRGADLEQEGASQETPIFWTLKSDKMLRHILLFDVNVNHQNKHGISPLMRCIEHINIEACILLLDAGADVNAADTSGFTPLMYAFEGQNLELCILCLDAGADVNAKNRFDISVLHTAIRTYDITFVHLLFDYGVEITDDAIGYAMNYCHMDVVRLFIERGAPMTNILFECLSFGVYELFPTLLENGADVHATRNGKTTMDSLFSYKRIIWCESDMNMCKELVLRGVSCMLHTHEHIMEHVDDMRLLEWLSTHCDVPVLEQECSICFELMQKYNHIHTECGHLFCKTCLFKWYKERDTCPMCRRDLDIEAFNICL